MQNLPSAHISPAENNQQLFLDHIFKSLPYYIFWKNKDLVYLGCNENFARLVNHNISEIIGLTDYDLNWGEGEADFYTQCDRKVMEGMKQVNLEETLHRPDGKKIVMLVSKVPVINERNEVVGILGISTDITQIKQVEEELSKAKIQAETASRAIRIFASSIAHELRTPLASISAYAHGIHHYLPPLLNAYQAASNADLLVGKIRSNHLESLRGIGGKIEKEVYYSNSMINMLLIKTNKALDQSLKLTNCSIAKCVTNAIDRYPFKTAKEAELIKWNSHSDFLFNGNELFMTHILFNLIKNSLYSIESVGKGEIEIWLEKTDKIGNFAF